LVAKRVGKSLCIADKTIYHMVDLHAMSIFQLLPVSQAVDPVSFEVKPSITVISPNEFLILSWTGASTLGVFVTGEGDPVRGTLEWSSHPEAICKTTLSQKVYVLINFGQVSTIHISRRFSQIILLKSTI